jgi:hypothetical protein
VADRAELGVDGKAAFALLGHDLQSGEAEFVGIRDGMEPLSARQARAARNALANLRERLGRPDLGFFFGPSHPYHFPGSQDGTEG